MGDSPRTFLSVIAHQNARVSYPAGPAYQSLMPTSIAIALASWKYLDRLSHSGQQYFSCIRFTGDDQPK